MQLIFVILSVSALYSFPTWAFDHSHGNWTKVLKEYQNSKGLVNYKKLKSDSKERKHIFDQYLSDVQAVQFSEYEAFSKEEKMAFLINAYNALTIKLIIDKYPVKSIKDIGGMFTKPWKVEFFSILGGKIKSLDPIEHEWLRPNFKDYRIHAAVNCASISCPPLRNEGFVATQLDKQLDGQMREWLKDNTRNQISSKAKAWKVSKIFDWYEDDFKNWGPGVVGVINKYFQKPLSREMASQIKIEYMDYDWNLNEAK